MPGFSGFTEYIHDGERFCYPDALKLLAEAKSCIHTGGSPTIVATMWRTEDIARIPIECSIEIAKASCSLTDTGEDEYVEVDAKDFYFYIRDHEGHVLADADTPKEALLEVERLFAEFDTGNIINYLSQTYQVTGINTVVCDNVKNEPYLLVVKAEFPEMPKYYTEDLKWRQPYSFNYEGSDKDFRKAVLQLAEQMDGHCDHCRRSCDVFQVRPYLREPDYGGSARCERCGTVTNHKLRTADGKWLCDNKYCYYHEHPHE